MMKLWRGIAAFFCCTAGLFAQGVRCVGPTHSDAVAGGSKAVEKVREGRFYAEVFDQLPSQPPLPEKDQILRIGMQVDLAAEQDLFKFINPYAVTSHFHMFINVNIFEGLVVSKGFQIVPGLAYQWEHSPDLKHWTFKLHPGACWSDGVAVRAQDFVLGWRTLCDPKTYAKECFDLPKAMSKGYLKRVPICHALDIFEGRLPVEQLGVYAEDDKTLCFELERPILPELLLTSLTGYRFYPMRPEHVEIFCAKDINRYAQVPGCGAFTLRGVQFPNNIYLKKNRFYWDKDQVLLQEVKVELRREYVMLKELWEGGEIDFYAVNREKASLTKQQREHLWNVRYSGNEGIWLNHRNRWLGNKKIRQALNVLFHRERMIDAFLFGATRTPFFGLLSPDSRAMKRFDAKQKEGECRWEELLLKDQKEMARKLLSEGIKEVRAASTEDPFKEEGISKHEGGPISLMLQHGYETASSALGLLQQDFNQFPDLLEVKVRHTKILPNRPQDMSLMAFFGPPHPFYRFTAFRAIADAKGNLRGNASGFNHEEFNRLMDDLESGSGMPQDPTEVEKWVDEKLYRLDQIVREEVPLIPWMEPILQYVMHPEVGGLPRADYQEGDSTHHYSGALYFKHLFIREPYDHYEHRCHSPNTHRKARHISENQRRSEKTG